MYKEYTDTCPYCGEPVISKWMEDGSGMISSSEYCLIADWIYHTICWDKQIEEYPP